MTQLTQIISALALLLPAAVMVREKERGTIRATHRLTARPIADHPPQEYFDDDVYYHRMWPYLFFVMGPIFHIPMKGSLALFFFVTSLYTFALMLIGIYFASLCRDLSQVGLLCVMAFMIMTLLAGQFTPPEAMPKPLLGIMYSLPTHYYLDIAFGISAKGSRLADSLAGDFDDDGYWGVNLPGGNVAVHATNGLKHNSVQCPGPLHMRSTYTRRPVTYG